MATNFVETKFTVESLVTPLIFSQPQTSTASTAKDYLLDVKTLRERADSGDASAQYLMGQSLRYGWYGCTINSFESNHYITLAAKKRETPAGRCALAVCFVNGLAGTGINDGKSLEFFRTASNAGYIPANWELAVSIIKAIAKSTKPVPAPHAAQDVAETPATLSFSPKATRPDTNKLAEAIILLKTAADAGFAPAFTNLSECYLDGFGVSQDYQLSFQYAKHAAEAGQAQGNFYLGLHFENGYGTLAVDKEQAQIFYKAALDQGYELARKYISTSSRSGCVIM
jgi:TPR repeat protein